MQEYLDYYIDEVNRGNRSFTEALDELVEIERKHNQTRREQANVKTANFPFIKTVEDFDFDFQPDINKKEILELIPSDSSTDTTIYCLLAPVVQARLILPQP